MNEHPELHLPGDLIYTPKGWCVLETVPAGDAADPAYVAREVTTNGLLSAGSVRATGGR